MKRLCADCGNLKDRLTTCALCNRYVCNYCYSRRHNQPGVTKSGKVAKRKVCFPVKTANLWGA